MEAGEIRFVRHVPRFIRQARQVVLRQGEVRCASAWQARHVPARHCSVCCVTARFGLVRQARHVMLSHVFPRRGMVRYGRHGWEGLGEPRLVGASSVLAGMVCIGMHIVFRLVMAGEVRRGLFCCGAFCPCGACFGRQGKLGQCGVRLCGARHGRNGSARFSKLWYVASR